MVILWSQPTELMKAFEEMSAKSADEGSLKNHFMRTLFLQTFMRLRPDLLDSLQDIRRIYTLLTTTALKDYKQW